ncbi:uncharacterized protein ACNS7B_018432 [Menidia menidia]
MSDLPDEAQRLKRAAWRAASRRYYARKVARQQAPPRPKPRPPKPRPFLLLANPPHDHRRRAPPPAGPQREAWGGGPVGAPNGGQTASNVQVGHFGLGHVTSS